MAFYRKLGSGWEYRITYRDSQGKNQNVDLKQKHLQKSLLSKQKLI